MIMNSFYEPTAIDKMWKTNWSDVHLSKRKIKLKVPSCKELERRTKESDCDKENEENCSKLK